jgi:hypothetical protein
MVMEEKRNSERSVDERFKPKGKPQPTGKRIGKSKPEKANNQQNRRVK